MLISEQITVMQKVISALTLVVRYKTQFQSVESLCNHTVVQANLCFLIAFKTYMNIKFSVLYELVQYIYLSQPCTYNTSTSTCAVHVFIHYYYQKKKS